MKAGIPELETFDIIGDIAIIKCKTEDPEVYKKVAEKILKRFKNIKTVVKISSETFGTYRIRNYEYIAGERKFITYHKENGCIFKVDITKVYFNPRLATERQRIVKEIPPSQEIFDMFAGVGPFAIQIAKYRDPEIVIACDINYYAYELLKENIKLNKVEEKVIPINNDSSLLVSEFKSYFDIIIMNLPSHGIYYLPYALEMCKKNGIIYMYQFWERKKEEKLIKKLKRFNVEILEMREVKSVSSAKNQYLVKLRKTK